MDSAELAHRFKYHAPDDVKKARHEKIRSHLGLIADVLNEELPDGREKSTAITKLEETMFWSNAAIARNP